MARLLKKNEELHGNKLARIRQFHHQFQVLQEFRSFQSCRLFQVEVLIEILPLLQMELFSIMPMAIVRGLTKAHFVNLQWEFRAEP